jgi:hypothetical protein
VSRGRQAGLTRMGAFLDRILGRNDVAELVRVQKEIEERYRQNSIAMDPTKPPGTRRQAFIKLRRLPEWSAYDAIRVHKHLLDLLDQQRWNLVHQARSEEFTWEEIGRALGMTRQGIHDWYNRTRS